MQPTNHWHQVQNGVCVCVCVCAHVRVRVYITSDTMPDTRLYQLLTMFFILATWLLRIVYHEGSCQAPLSFSRQEPGSPASYTCCLSFISVYVVVCRWRMWRMRCDMSWY